MYKVLALDLDGTVLTDQHTIHPAVKQAIAHVKQDCHVVIVTGRHHTAARLYHDELGLTTPIICCNGTYLYDYVTDCVLAHNAVDKQHASMFVRLAQKYQLKLVMYVTDTMVHSISNPVKYMIELEEFSKTLPKGKGPKIKQISTFEDVIAATDFVWEFVVEGENNAIKQFLNEPFITTHFTLERSWLNRLSCYSKQNSKGKRVADYVESLGLHFSDVMAVGDNHNDISMLKYAGLSVAMANADDVVKQFASIVCESDNNEGGLGHLIRNQIRGQ
ncbi:MAG: Cof-type HAD-IIB family hydrolase [Vibrio sp.]|uniref:Cof-type HAD-IIB family hydrolase n=1 Tax=Vibrio sp. TaxID=678 RepID=UPI003A88444F